FEAPGALQTVLTAHARGHLGHRAEPGRRDGLPALLADSVVAIAQTLQRLAEPLCALHEKAPCREAHFEVRVAAEDVRAVCQSVAVGTRAADLLDHRAAARVADPVHQAVQLRFQVLPDLVHGSLPLRLWT